MTKNTDTDPAAADQQSLPPGIVKVQPLAHPIESAGEVITELHWKPMRAGYAKKLPAAGELRLEHLLEVAANATGQPSSVIEAVQSEDLGTLMETVLGFLRSAQLTGAPS